MNPGGLVAITVVMAASAAWFVWRAFRPSARTAGGVALLIAAVALAAGRQFVLAVPIGVLGLSLLRGAQAAARAAPQPGRISEVQTKFLAMRLDHDSGEMDGEVLSGNFAGSMLSQMTAEALQGLVLELEDDPDSLSLLLAYLDRQRPPEEDATAGALPESGGHMSAEEAYRMLGLKPGAGVEEVRLAHRRLMKRVHPDLGGSGALAALINAAKARLDP